MNIMNIKRNERDWAGQLISWIKSAIENNATIFQDATNDAGVKMESGRTITTRDDLADPVKFTQNESLLKQRANDLLHDLGQLYLNGELKPAINITGNIVNTVQQASNIIIPQF
jgi:hypothetical protein